MIIRTSDRNHVGNLVGRSHDPVTVVPLWNLSLRQLFNTATREQPQNKLKVGHLEICGKYHLYHPGNTVLSF